MLNRLDYAMFDVLRAKSSGLRSAVGAPLLCARRYPLREIAVSPRDSNPNILATQLAWLFWCPGGTSAGRVLG